MGPLTWLALPVVVGTSGAIARILDRRRERRRQAAVLQDLGDAAQTTKDLLARDMAKPATVEGVVAEHAHAASFHPHGTSFLDEFNAYAITDVASDVVLEIEGGGRVKLEGPMQVLVGAYESEHDAPLAKAEKVGAPALAEKKVRRTRGQFRFVRGGSRVRARGMLVPAPDDTAHYRERSSAFRMLPTEVAHTSIIQVAAVDPAEPATVAPRRWFTGVFLASLALGVGLPVYEIRYAPTIIAYAPAAQAGALPRASTACADRGIDDIAHDRAPSCSDSYVEGMNAFAKGDFAAASRAFLAAGDDHPPSLPETEAHLFAHQYDAAALTAHRMVTHFYPGPETAEKRYLDCVASLLDHRAKEGKWSGYRKYCAQDATTKYFRELDAEGEGDTNEWFEFHGMGYRTDASWDAVGKPFTAPVAPGARLFARPIGVEKNLLDRVVLAKGDGRRETGPYGRVGIYKFEIPDVYASFTTLAAELVLFYANAGLPERAKPYWPILDRVADNVENDRTFHVLETPFDWEKKEVETEATMMTYVMSVAASAAFYAHEDARMQRYVKLGEPHSAHVLRQLVAMTNLKAPWEEPVEDGHWPDRAAIFANFADGELIVKELVKRKSTGRDELPRLLPHVQAHKEAFGPWFDTQFPAGCVTCGASKWLEHVSDRWAVGELLGKKQPPPKAFVDALTDPEIAFEVDELETFFGRKQ